MNTEAQYLSPKVHKPIHILLADDGSLHAMAAVALLSDLPFPQGSSANVLGVLIPREAGGHAALEAALEQSATMLEESGLRVEAQLQSGNPAEKLIEFAEQDRPDLIVLGAKGLRHTLGILLGGVAQQVVEYAHRPVLIVRAPYDGVNRVLFVTDGSKYSQCALEFLGSHTQREAPHARPRFPLPQGTELHVMHVLPPPPEVHRVIRSWPIGSEVLPALTTQEIEEALTRQAEEEECEGKQLLDTTLRSLKDVGLDAVAVLRRGDAATEMIEYIKENKVDLVVCGSRGLGRMAGWLLGSVSRKLVHYAGCSVLIVKDDPENTR